MLVKKYSENDKFLFILLCTWRFLIGSSRAADGEICADILILGHTERSLALSLSRKGCSRDGFWRVVWRIVTTLYYMLMRSSRKCALESIVKLIVGQRIGRSATSATHFCGVCVSKGGSCREKRNCVITQSPHGPRGMRKRWREREKQGGKFWVGWFLMKNTRVLSSWSVLISTADSAEGAKGFSRRIFFHHVQLFYLVLDRHAACIFRWLQSSS